MKNFLILFFCAISALEAYAQHEGSNFNSTGRAGVSTTMSTDYQANGINPANVAFEPLGEDNHFTLGGLEIGLTAYSEALTLGEVSLSVFSFKNKFTIEEKGNAALKLASSELAISTDLLSKGIAYYHEKIGGFAFSQKQTLRWRSNFNPLTAQMAFLGAGSSYFSNLLLNDSSVVPNTPENYALYQDNILSGIDPLDTMMLSEIFNGSKMKFSWLSEFTLSYGIKIIDKDALKVAAGIGAKYIMGMGFIDMSVEDGKLHAISAFPPAFDIKVDSAALAGGKSVTGGGYKPIGKGYGFDFGITIEILEKLKLGASVVNIGKVVWKGNIYEVKDQPVTKLSTLGMNNFNMFSEINEFVSSEGMFTYEAKESHTTKLPTTLRLGASFKPAEFFEFGTDVVIPVTDYAGNYDKTIVAVGGDLKPFRWLRFSSGLSFGGDYTKRLMVPSA